MFPLKRLYIRPLKWALLGKLLAKQLLISLKSISDSFSGKYATRDKAIFLLGLCIGSRVSELCQLKVADVWRNGKPVNTIVIRPETAKRKKARRVPIDVNPIAQNIISEFMAWKQSHGESVEQEAPLFVSQNNRYCYIFPMTRSQSLKKGTIDSLKLKPNTKPNKKRPDACINLELESQTNRCIQRIFIRFKAHEVSDVLSSRACEQGCFDV